MFKLSKALLESEYITKVLIFVVSHIYRINNGSKFNCISKQRKSFVASQKSSATTANPIPSYDFKLISVYFVVTTMSLIMCQSNALII